MAAREAPPAQAPQLKRAIGTLDAYALGFGSMVGFGWVVLTGGWLEEAGALGAVLALVAGGLVMGLVGTVYGELASAMPRTGGEHAYMMRGLGARWAFVGSWGITGGYVTIVAFEAVALPRTIGYIAPQIDQVYLWTVFGSDVHLLWALIGMVAAVAVTALNYVGIKAAAVTQTFVVLFLVLVGVLLVTGAGTGGSLRDMEPLLTSPAGVITVLVAVPFLFVGFDVLPQVAEELRMAPRRLGRLIVVSVLVATVWYVMTALTTASSMPRARLLETDLATADAMGALYDSPVMANVLLAGGLAGIVTSWIALLIGASRLMYAMGRSGMLPRWFAHLHPRHQTPSHAVLFVGALSVLAPLLGEGALGWLVDSGSPSIVVTYLLVCVVFLVLRRREPALERPFRAGGATAGTLVGVLGVVLTLGLLTLYVPGMPASISPVSYLLFGAWWLLGLVFLLRVPRGIRPGPDSEHDLLQALAARRQR